MIRCYVALFIHLLRLTFIDGQRQLEPVVISSNNTSPAFREGENIVITCSLDYIRTGGDNLLWYRVQGSVKEMIGSKMIRAREFNNERYEFDLIDSSSTSAIHKLTIKSLKIEDSATIECSALSARKASLPLIVCIDPNSDSCRCMIKEGWPSPDCFKTFQRAKSQFKGYRAAVIVLSIIVFLLFVLCVCQTIYILRECIVRYRYWRDKTEASEPLTARINPSAVEHVPPQASALKNRKPGGGQIVPSGNVTFADGSPNVSIVMGNAYPMVAQGAHIVSPTGVLMSPGHLDAAHGYYASGEGYQSPTTVPYGSSINIYQAAAKPDDIYRNAGNSFVYNSPGFPTPNNPAENSYYQVVNPQAQFPPSHVGNSPNNLTLPSYSEVPRGYADQMVANNLNDSRVMLEGHRGSQVLYSSNADLHQGNTMYTDPGSTSV